MKDQEQKTPRKQYQEQTPLQVVIIIIIIIGSIALGGPWPS